MTITLAKIALAYILGGMVAGIGLIILWIPTVVKFQINGKDFDTYCEKACDLLGDKYKKSKLYQKFDALSMKKFNFLILAFWPIMAPYAAWMFCEAFQIMDQLAFYKQES